MTWLGDTEKRPVDAAREKLLAQREALVKEVEVLSMKPMNKTQSAQIGRLEDLTALAKKIKGIDKKLGREVN